MHLTFGLLLGTDFFTFFGDPADIPIAIPQVLFTGNADVFCHRLIAFNICVFTQEASCFDKGFDGPIVQEGNHGTFTTA